MNTELVIPRHVAIIMDGNGRWAKRRGLDRSEGHREGAKTVRRVTEACIDLGVEQLTLYCFSSENWKRPQPELDALMQLLKFYLISEREKMFRENIRLQIIGRRDRIADDVQEEMDRSIDFCRSNTGLILRLAINYGGRGEIVDAVKQILHLTDTPEKRTRLLQEAGCSSLDEWLTEQRFSDYLYTAGYTDPDLLIRTAGEYRLSNYLLWQLSYAELWVTDVLWPDFNRETLLEAFQNFSKRDRRYGGLSH